jgi:hypothetical protein
MATTAPPKAVRGKDGSVIDVIDLDSHKEVIKRMKAEQDANLEMRLKMCNPKIAREAEMRKPMFRWKVEFRVIEKKTTKPVEDRYADNIDDGDDNDFKFRSVTKHADAQDEKGAWAKCCDQMQSWPSPKIAKPKFTKLKQIKM